MEDIKVRLCRLCLTVIDGENYETIDPAGVLLLKSDYGSSKNIMCKICSPRLSAALKFKSTCLDTNDRIISYVNDTTVLPLDLIEIYMKERECKHILDHVKVCRLCMQSINNISEVISLNEEHTDMIQKFVPLMKIYIINEPVICKLCVDFLTLHCNFLNKCWDLEQSVGMICNGQIPDAPSPVPSLQASVKMEDDVDSDDVDQLNQIEYIDTNYAEIKTERETAVQEMCFPSAETHCFDIDNKTGRKWDIQRHVLTHKDYSEVRMYKCETCKFETKHKKWLKFHMLLHKNTSEVQMYKCENCDFKTKFKRYLKTHMLRHKVPLEVQINKCANCNFETKHKRSLRNHMLIHKNPSEIQMYKCELCDFVTRHASNRKKHMIMHKDRSEVETYKCENCDYKTAFQYLLKRHMLIHRNPSEVHMYKCETCNYETKHKSGLKTHMLVHKDPSEVQIYKCETCNYETKRKQGLKSHLLLHKNTSEVQMYKCGTCNYQTKYKSGLKSHMLKHKNTLQLQMYKCETCNFQTKYKADLNKHVLKHKGRRSEGEMSQL